MAASKILKVQKVKAFNNVANSLEMNINLLLKLLGRWEMSLRWLKKNDMKDRENRTFIFGLILMFVCGIALAIDLVNIERGNGGYISAVIQLFGIIIGYLKVIKTID